MTDLSLADAAFSNFSRAYRRALEAYVSAPTPETREKGEGLGELAARAGVAVTRVVEAHRDALAAVVPLSPNIDDVLRSAKLAEVFLETCLRPFDAALLESRGLREHAQQAADLLTACRIEGAALDEALAGLSFSVAHDIREPLRAIDAATLELLKNQGDDLADETRGYLNQVRSMLARLDGLIDGTLALSDLSQRRMRIRDVDLSHLFNLLAQDLLLSDPEREVTFVVAPDVHAAADPDLIVVALRHLLDNAWKFTSTHDSARIEFGVTQRKGRPVYFVTDDGIGFEMAHADRLGIAFQKLHPPEEYPGIGVGAASVEQIVHRHGGDFWAEGNVGEGATFFFTLDAARLETGAPARERRAETKRAA